MSLFITNDCISCDICEPSCPNKAIFPREEFYVINTDLCNECNGYYTYPQCQQVCPVSCIIHITD